MAVFGALGPYDESIEQFADYADRCDAFMGANDIADDRKVNLFLATVGPSTYKLLKNLCDPQNPKDRTYAQLKTLLNNHYSPAPITIAERHRFWTAQQGENEKVADYVVCLKKLASTCQFGAFLDEALRDRLVSGLNQKMSRTQRHLLTQRDLTFHIAKQTCVSEELANQANKAYMGEPSGVAEAHRVQQTRNKPGQFQKSSNPKPSNDKKCYRCGANHSPNECKYKEATCHGCGKKGHIRPVCLSSKKQSRSSSQTGAYFPKRAVHAVAEPSSCDDEPGASSGAVFGLYTVSSVDGPRSSTNPYIIKVSIDDYVLNMEWDTGSTRSTINEYLYREKFSKYPLRDAGVKLTAYNESEVPVLGCITIPVKYGDQPVRQLDLIVVEGHRPALFGRDWMMKIKLDYGSIFSISDRVLKNNNTESWPESIHDNFVLLLEKHSNMFKSVDTGITHFKASLKLKPGAHSVYQKARPVPYALVNDVDQEYQRLKDCNILFPISHSNWASPVVHVPKGPGSVRVCGDYKAVNAEIEDDGYKLPNAQDMFAKIAQNGKVPQVYSVLDLAGAFNQLLLDSESSQLLVLNTHQGLMGTNRLCFGVKTAPAQFQATMDKILSGVKGVFCYIDDILVVTESVEEHLTVLKQVFERLTKYNVKLNQVKCRFFQQEIQYLGHKLSADGIRPLQGKLEAIQKAKRPTNVSELKSLLGMINYYGKFLPNLATTLHPLYSLLQHDVRWFWSNDCEQSFIQVKEMLTGDNVLTHFDPNKPLILGVDASPYGLGAVLSHKMEDGSERPLAYASRTLSPAERNYPQIEKEGLAIIYGIKKFHMYLYGVKFTLVTDHQPLTRIFGPKSGIPPLAAARMQRWALILAGYNYDIIYRSSENNANADCLSRLPMQDLQESDPDEVYVFHSAVESLPITAKRVAESTCKDKLLSRVYEYTSAGWPSYCDDKELEPYWRVRHELSLELGCVLWGRRVVIPSNLQDNIMCELHEGHPGMSRMKALARSFVWWPGLDADIEDWVRSCNSCITTQGSPKAVPLLLWPWATEPWQRIHIDFAEISGQQFLLVVDSHSKWMEVVPMESTTAHVTLTVLRNMFARYGLPNEVVSDNGPQFIANEFKEFLKKNCIKHTLCPPYHPASNGLAERHVQTFKNMYKKYKGVQDVHHIVADILFRYRNMPHSTTGTTPAELFLKRTPRTRLSLLKPSLQRNVELSQAKAKLYKDGSNPRPRSYHKFQKVRVLNKRGGKVKWIPGTILEIKGPNTYIVRIPGNDRRFVHADHLIADDGVQIESDNSIPVAPSIVPVSMPEESMPILEQEPVEEVPLKPVTHLKTPRRVQVTPEMVTSPEMSKTTRSGRVVKPPNKLNL
jgi:hypothetical protein